MSQLGIDELYADNMFGNLNEPHLACALLLDVSGSMSGEKIRSLNEAIKRFKEQICKDEIARKRVEVAIITFGQYAEIVSDFKPIPQMPTPDLVTRGRTPMAEGIQLAIDLVKKKTKLWQTMGTPCHKPWIFMITDGASTSDEQDMKLAAQRIAEEENKGTVGKMKFWALGVGDYNKEELFSLTNRVLELQSYNFVNIFDWLSESMSSISNSQVGTDVELDLLPEDTKIADRDPNRL